MTKQTHPQVASNAHDIGYVIGKLEMIDQRVASQHEEIAEILKALNDISSKMTLWSYTLRIGKVLALSVPFLFAANFEGLSGLWKDL